MSKIFLVKDLSNEIIEFENFDEADERFQNYLNSTELIEKDEVENEGIIKSRTHKKVGQIEINNKCVHVKIPFFEPSDQPKIQISKIGESPDQLRAKMNVISEEWTK